MLPTFSPHWAVAVDSNTSSGLDDFSDTPGTSDDVNSTASSATVSPAIVNHTTILPQVTPQCSVSKTVRRNVVLDSSHNASSTSHSSPVVNDETLSEVSDCDQETTSDVELDSWMCQVAGVRLN